MCSKRPEFVGSKRLLVHPQPMKIEGYPSKGTDGVLETRSEGLIGVNNPIQPLINGMISVQEIMILTPKIKVFPRRYALKQTQGP